MSCHSLQRQNFTNLEQLRAYHNEHFIRLAYQSILGREVDVEGLHHHLQLFYQNLEPAEFLTTLRNSDEYKVKFSSSKENVSLAALENSTSRVDELFSSTAIDRVASILKTKP